MTIEITYLEDAIAPWSRQAAAYRSPERTAEPVTVRGGTTTLAALMRLVRAGTPIQLRTTIAGSHHPHRVRFDRLDGHDVVCVGRFWQDGQRYSQELRFEDYAITAVTIHPPNHVFPEEMPPPS